GRLVERRPPGPAVVALPRPLHLDHIGAEIGQHLRTPRAGQHARQVQHPDAVHRHGLACTITTHYRFLFRYPASCALRTTPPHLSYSSRTNFAQVATSLPTTLLPCACSAWRKRGSR